MSPRLNPQTLLLSNRQKFSRSAVIYDLSTSLNCSFLMNKDRIYLKLSDIDEKLYNLDVSIENAVAVRDRKELNKKKSSLLKEKKKLTKRLDR